MVDDLEKKFIGPGTAGIAQRIPLIDEYEIDKSVTKEGEYKLSVLEYNRVMPCSHNQY